MKFRKVPAGERVDRTVFSAVRERLDHAVHYGLFTCPFCGEAFRLQWTDFYDHLHTRGGILDADMERELDRFRSLREDVWESFLDFECPGCKAPFRLFYEGLEVSMGQWEFRLNEVIEPVSRSKAKGR
jgi:hypothetical protein